MRKLLALLAALFTVLLLIAAGYLNHRAGVLSRQAVGARHMVDTIDLGGGVNSEQETERHERAHELELQARNLRSVSALSLPAAFGFGGVCVVLLILGGKKEESIYNRHKNR